MIANGIYIVNPINFLQVNQYVYLSIMSEMIDQWNILCMSEAMSVSVSIETWTSSVMLRKLKAEVCHIEEMNH